MVKLSNQSTFDTAEGLKPNWYYGYKAC